ncbi:nucleoside hydrolase, partial [Candidatus Woesearchaeota archaeon]|nr:nucleoside hydrolase [Candidatus Woesearchaeota archaeon]
MSKYLISTDIGSDIDDAISLLAMLNSGMDLGGIYVVNGDVKSRAYIAKHMVNLAEKNIPVVVGDDDPLWSMMPPYKHFEDCYVDECFIDEEASRYEPDLHYLDFSEVGIQEDGVEHMVATLKKEPCSVISLAPMTTIAKAIQQGAPIERIYVMGTCLGDRFEHNIRDDTGAANIVFESGVPMTIVPGDVCGKYLLPLSIMKGMTSKAGEYVRRMILAHNAVKTATRYANKQLPRNIDTGNLHERLRGVMAPTQETPEKTHRQL